MIRHATINDLEEIAKIEKESYPLLEAADKKSIKSRIEAFGDCFWLNVKDEKIVSFVNGMVSDQKDLVDEMYHDARMHKSDGKWQMIFSVVVAPNERGKGYAKDAMIQMIKDVKKRGKLGIVLTCKERLISFYEQFGFVNEGKSLSNHGNAEWYQMRLEF